MIFRGSRYTNTPVYQVKKGDRPVFDMRGYFEFKKSSLMFHEWRRSDTFSAIAAKYYNSATLWWVFLEANPHLASEMSLKPGDRIIVPPINEILNYVNNRGGY